MLYFDSIDNYRIYAIVAWDNVNLLTIIFNYGISYAHYLNFNQRHCNLHCYKIYSFRSLKKKGLFTKLSTINFCGMMAELGI